MLDSGNNTDEQLDTTQPADVVATDAEVTEGAPQPEATEVLNIDLDSEAASEEEAKNENGETDWKAVAHQEREKRKRKNAVIDEQAKELAAVKQSLEEIKNQVNDNGSFISEQQVKQHQSRAPKLADFTDQYGDVNEQEYSKALAEHIAKTPQVRKPEPEPEPQPQAVQSNPQFTASEQELIAKYPQYEEEKRTAIKLLHLTPELQAHFEKIAKDEGIEMRAVYSTFGRSQQHRDMFIQAVGTNNGKIIREAMQGAASMTNIGKKKPIPSTPEPEITSSGPVDNAQAAIDKAFDKWTETGSRADYMIYSNLKKQSKNSKG